MRPTPSSRPVLARRSQAAPAVEGIRMAAAVFMRAAVRDQGITPMRRENLEALAALLSEVAGDLEEAPRPSNPPMWRS